MTLVFVDVLREYLPVDSGFDGSSVDVISEKVRLLPVLSSMVKLNLVLSDACLQCRGY